MRDSGENAYAHNYARALSTVRLNKEADVPVSEPGALISAKHRRRESLKPFENTKRCTLTGSA